MSAVVLVVAAAVLAVLAVLVLRDGARRPDRDQWQAERITPGGWAVLTVAGMAVGLLLGVLAFDGLWLAVDWR